MIGTWARRLAAGAWRHPGETVVAVWAVAYALYLTVTPVVDPIELRAVWPEVLVAVWFTCLFVGGLLILAGFVERLVAPVGYVAVGVAAAELGAVLLTRPIGPEDGFYGAVGLGVAAWMLVDAYRSHTGALNGKHDARGH